MRYLIYFLIFSSGLIFHKVANEIYDYKWIQAWDSELCRKLYKDALNDSKNEAPLSTSFKCADDNMGLSYYFTYILIRPRFAMEDGWGF